MINIIIRSPLTQEDFDRYYLLRYQVLRAPYGREKGSEKDELEDDSIHRIALLEGKITAVGRLHFINDSIAQIRYMAVDKKFTNNGIGKLILASLEQQAKENNIQSIILHARESAVGFYKKQGYELIKKSHLLFDEIQHFEMVKALN